MEIKIHKCFRLNEKSFSSVNELLNFSKNISPEVFSFLTNWFNDDDSLEVQTSGSTGVPKIIQLKKEFMKNSALATGAFFNLKENTTALLCMSTEFIAGRLMLVRALELGWHLDIVDPSSNPLKNLNKEYDFSAMVPLQLHNSLNEIHKIKKLIVGGGIVSYELENKIKDLNTEVFATYGMTETITHIAIKKLNNFSHFEHNKKPYYQVFPNVKISIDSRDCLVIVAPKVSDEAIVTNDIVKIHSETEFEWLGRFDTIINSGGVKLIPEQIEHKISEIINERFIVSGLKDELLGEKLVLIVEGNEDLNLMQKVKQLTSLSKFEQPKEIYFLSKFIETPTQKINRKKTIQLL